jgi:hypothetical protein
MPDETHAKAFPSPARRGRQAALRFVCFLRFQSHPQFAGRACLPGIGPLKTRLRLMKRPVSGEACLAPTGQIGFTRRMSA